MRRAPTSFQPGRYALLLSWERERVGGRRPLSCSGRWLSLKALGGASRDRALMVALAIGRVAGGLGAFSGSREGYLVLVELQEVVGGGDQSPL